MRCPEPDRLRQAARDKAVSEYSTAVMGDRYMALYEDVWRMMKDRRQVVGEAS